MQFSVNHKQTARSFERHCARDNSTPPEERQTFSLVVSNSQIDLRRQINLRTSAASVQAQQTAMSALADYFQSAKADIAFCCRDFNRRALPNWELLSQQNAP